MSQSRELSTEEKLQHAVAARDDLAAELANTEKVLARREAQLKETKAQLAERVAQLVPYAEQANAENGYLDGLFIVAQAGYAYDVRAIGGLCRATRAEEACVPFTPASNTQAAFLLTPDSLLQTVCGHLWRACTTGRESGRR